MVHLKRIAQSTSWLAFAIAIVPCLATAAPPSPAPAAGTHGTVPPGFMAVLPADMHDFDFLVGAWTTKQRRLKARNVGSTVWVDAPANQHCAVSYLDGKAIIDQSRFPDGRAAGLFLYDFNSEKRQWAIYWVDPQTGDPGTPAVGGFDGSHGEFYGDDEDGGHPIKVRVTWVNVDKDHARWEQAFSYDDRTWETNWIAEFTRADPAAACARP